MSNGHVPPRRPRTKAEVSDALAVDWLRIAPSGQREIVAAQIGASCGKVISRAIAGEHLPEAHTILNSLIADDAALFNVFRLYDFVAVRCSASTDSDMATISAMLHAATEYLDRMKDGQRCPSDTSALAKLFTPLIPAMLAIVEEARRT